VSQASTFDVVNTLFPKNLRGKENTPMLRQHISLRSPIILGLKVTSTFIDVEGFSLSLEGVNE